MPVHMYYRPSKAFKFCINWACIHYVFRAPGYLQFVIIYYCTKVIQLVMYSRQCCFPIGALRQFAITQQRKYMVCLIIHFCGKRSTYTNWQAVAECPSILFYAMHFPGWMAYI